MSLILVAALLCSLLPTMSLSAVAEDIISARTESVQAAPEEETGLSAQPEQAETPLTTGENYLTFTAEEANSTITLNWVSGSKVQIKPGSTAVLIGGGAATSTDWQGYTEETVITLASVGDSVQFKGENVITNNSYHFTMTGKIAASGSVTSLTDGNGGNDTLRVGPFRSLPLKWYIMSAEQMLLRKHFREI